MDSEKHCRYQHPVMLNYYTDNPVFNHLFIGETKDLYLLSIISLLQSEKVLIVNRCQRNGLILFKPYHAEFAGPGALVGGQYDSDCQGILPIGNLSLLTVESYEERQQGYLIRRHWIRLIKQITQNPSPQQRVERVLDQFQQYFPPEMVDNIPDIVFALLVGVLPPTVGIVRCLGKDISYANRPIISKIG